ASKTPMRAGCFPPTCLSSACRLASNQGNRAGRNQMIALQTSPPAPPQPKTPDGVEPPAPRVSPTPATNGNAAHRAVNLASFPADPAAIGLLPRSIAERLKIVPLQRRGDQLMVAMTDTTNVHTIDEVQRISGCRIGAVAAGAVEIEMAIARLYNTPAEPARTE